MSFQKVDLDPVGLIRSLEFGSRRQPAFVSRSQVSASEPAYAPRQAMHVTRVLGKLCFTCRSVNALNDKFCCDCGAPLFRPGASQMLRPGHPFKDGAS